MTEQAVKTKQPTFYNKGHAFIRTWDFATTDRWTQQKGWFSDDPGEVYEDLTSPKWKEIPAEQAQVRINRLGGARDEYMAPVGTGPAAESEDVS